MSGGPARYINHSCSPNCVAEVMALERDKEHKIIISTKRKIAMGEEVAGWSGLGDFGGFFGGGLGDFGGWFGRFWGVFLGVVG